MFGKSNNEKSAVVGSMNQFSNGTVITGNLNTDGDMRMDGKLVGNIQSKAKVVIGAAGVVEGDIYCQNAFVEGKINGNIQASELLILSKSAVVEGDIMMKKLVVEEGARFNGKCTMGVSISRNESLENSGGSAKPLTTSKAS